MVCQKHLKDLPSLTHVFPGMMYEEMNFFFPICAFHLFQANLDCKILERRGDTLCCLSSFLFLMKTFLGFWQLKRLIECYI